MKPFSGCESFAGLCESESSLSNKVANGSSKSNLSNIVPRALTFGGTDVTVIWPHSQNPMGIPFSYSLGTRDEPLRTFAWEATSHIALAIWVRVRVTGDAHM